MGRRRWTSCLPRFARGPLACAVVLLVVSVRMLIFDARPACVPLLTPAPAPTRSPPIPVPPSTPAPTPTLPPPLPPLPPAPPPTTVLYPGQFLLTGQRLISHDGGRAVSIIGSQLCPTAPEPGGVNADHDGRPGVGCRGDRVRSRGQAFLAHQSDDNLCLYWGTPSKNEGGAWCERLTGCTLARGLALGLDVDGRLVGYCGSKRV